MTNRAKKLASLTAAGVGAVTLTSGLAKASIIEVDVNTTVSFTSNSNPASFHVNSHAFNFGSLAPHFSVDLYSNVGGANTWNRFANLYHGNRSTQFLNPGNARIAAGKTWNQAVTGTGTYGRLADRSWGGKSTIKGKPAGSNFYELFRFSNDGGTNFNYGWVQYNVIMTEINSSLASNGPNITLDRVAWQTTNGVTIAAGDTGVTPTPEPGTSPNPRSVRSSSEPKACGAGARPESRRRSAPWLSRIAWRLVSSW